MRFLFCFFFFLAIALVVVSPLLSPVHALPVRRLARRAPITTVTGTSDVKTDADKPKNDKTTETKTGDSAKDDKVKVNAVMRPPADNILRMETGQPAAVEQATAAVNTKNGGGTTTEKPKTATSPSNKTPVAEPKKLDTKNVPQASAEEKAQIEKNDNVIRQLQLGIDSLMPILNTLLEKARRAKGITTKEVLQQEHTGNKSPANVLRLQWNTIERSEDMLEEIVGVLPIVLAYVKGLEKKADSADD